MKFSISRETLLKPLQLVAGVVERRQTLPVLANVLLSLEDGVLSITGTDLEVEIVGRVDVESTVTEGETTVPAKKFFDICRSLPEGNLLEFVLEDQRVIVKSGRSRFTLSTLPANEFPNVEEGDNELSFSCKQFEIKRLIDRTSFAMAQQDVRYYLNGMLWEAGNNRLRVVSTDGHRLAMCTREIELSHTELLQAILPRKGVIELSRLVGGGDEFVEISIGKTHLRAKTQDYTFTSKLVDGKFPDYERDLPKGGNQIVLGDRNDLKQAFTRTAILSNEKYRGVRLLLEKGQMTVVANNPEQEEAQDQVTVDYDGEAMELGFNVSYLQDVSSVLESDKIKITLTDANSSALLEEPEESDSAYVVMPMRL